MSDLIASMPVRVVTGLLKGERQLNTEGNADVWNELVTELRLKTTRRLNFVWGQRAKKFTSSGRSPSLWTKGENGVADALASSPLRCTTQIRRH